MLDVRDLACSNLYAARCESGRTLLLFNRSQVQLNNTSNK